MRCRAFPCAGGFKDYDPVVVLEGMTSSKEGAREGVAHQHGFNKPLVRLRLRLRCGAPCLERMLEVTAQRIHRATVGSRNEIRLSHAPHCCVLFSEQAGPHWSIATREPGGGLKLLPQKHWPLASTPATAPAPEYPNAQHSSAHSSYEWTV